MAAVGGSAVSSPVPDEEVAGTRDGVDVVDETGAGDELGVGVGVGVGSGGAGVGTGVGAERQAKPGLIGRLPAWTRIGYRGTLDETFSGRENGVGFLRFAMAMSVVVSHSGILGFGRPDLLGQQFRNQQALGGLAVAGFFILSGMLITRSARRTGFGRYCWHRVLRIFPGLWVCLLVTAFGVAPLIAYHEWGTLDGFWTPGKGSPFGYVRNNMWTGIRQSGIHDLLASSTPWGRLTKASAFDGALWSLCYELLCYMVVGALLVTGVLRTARRLVPLLAVLLYARILMDFRLSHGWGGGVMAQYDRFDTTLFGIIDLRWVVYLGFLFLAAASLELYRERIPIHDGLGVAALAVCLGTLLFGGWYAIGYPLLTYVVVWAACRLPRWLHWVGRKNDYSYGIYIYGLVGQQVLASFGWNRWGYWPYLALSVSLAWTAAFLSWHLVEKHFLKLKNWTPQRRGRWAAADPVVSVPAGRVPEAGAEPAQAPAPAPAAAPAV